MKRAINFWVQTAGQRDVLGFAIFGGLCVVATATVSILFSQTMKEAALKRFHLATASYPAWAAHQMVPAMYNFENRIRFSNVIHPQGEFDTQHPSYLGDAVNHFPARFITFGDQRRVFADGKDGMFEMTSAFAGTTLVSRWELIHQNDDTVHVHRVFEKFHYSNDLQRADEDE